MASLQSFIDNMPLFWRNRYGTSTKFVAWANELLEELQERGFLPTTEKESGVLVNKDVWIDKPSDLLFLERVYSPLDERQEYRVTEVNNKFKLLDTVFTDEAAADQITSSAFGDYAADGITCTDLVDTDYIADYFENYLFLITAGTLVNSSVIIDGNDASTDPGGTAIDFLHSFSAALSGTKVTAARLVPPGYYVMIRYQSVITAISAASDEIPIGDDCEKRLVPAWLRYCCERETSSISKETIYWQERAYEILYSVQASRLSRATTPVKGRRLIGFEKNSYRTQKYHPDYPEVQ